MKFLWPMIYLSLYHRPLYHYYYNLVERSDSDHAYININKAKMVTMIVTMMVTIDVLYFKLEYLVVGLEIRLPQYTIENPRQTN